MVRAGTVPSTVQGVFPVERTGPERPTAAQNGQIGGLKAPSEETSMAKAPTSRQGQLSLDLPQDERLGYRGPAVTDIVGITYRQLDYWARTGLVSPSIRKAEGSGSQRLYSFEDIVRLRVVKRLLDTGVTLERIRAALEELARQGRELSDVTLASDGRTVYAIDDDRQLLDLLKRGQGVFAIALDPLVDELRGEVSVLPSLRGVTIEPAADGADVVPFDVRAV